MGGQEADIWEDENDEARWCVTLGGSNVCVGDDLLFGEGAARATSCT
jgi:hypothetical protein